MQAALRGVTVVLLLGICAVAGRAQGSHGYGYVGGTVGGPVDSGGLIGLGGELGGRITVTGDIGRASEATIVGAGLQFHPGLFGRIDPFIGVGPSFAFGGGNTGAYLNIGGGLNYWFYSHLGLRFEYRGFAALNDVKGFSELRFGIAIR